MDKKRLEKYRKQLQRERRAILLKDSKAAWAASIRRTRHIGDFRNWKNHDEYQKSLARLIRDLQADEQTKSST